MNTWALWVGGAAALAPILIHLLTKPKPVRFPFPTLRFLRKAVEQRKARDRLRDWILLALRTAAILLIAVAVARPQFGKAPLVDPAAPGDAVRVVLLDVSRSMAASNQGVQRFEKARSMAADYLAFQPGLRANVVLAGANANAAFDQPTENLAALREEVRKSTPTHERLNLAAALRRSGELLERGGEQIRRELVIVSDFQRANWTSADFTAIPKETAIRLEYVAGVERPDNLAILKVELAGNAESGAAAKLLVDVGNYSGQARRARLEIRLDDEVQTAEPLLAANAKTTVAVEIAAPRSGWRVGTATLNGAADALASDDRRMFAVHVRTPPVYLLASRQLAELRGSSYFVERAAAPLGKEKTQAREKVVRVTPEKLDREAMQGVEVVLIDHPGRLPKPAIALLVEAMRRGRGVLYFAAEPVDAENLRAIAEAAGGDFKPPVDFLPSAVGSSRRNLFFSDVRRGEPPFRVFGDGFESLAKPLRFGGGLATRKRDSGMADEVFATLSDGSAAVTTTSVGAGRLGVFNADLSLSNLPSSPMLVPMLGEWLGMLRGKQAIDPSLACGEANALYLPPEAGTVDQLRIVQSGDSGFEASDTGALAADAGAVVWRWRQVGPPGAYRVMKGDACVFAAAAATPPEEADLAVIPPNLVENRLAGGRTIESSTSNEEESRDDRWTWAAIACLVCLLGELVALKAFRS